MNKHSKAFEDKKAALQEVEKELREAIDAESEDVELRVIQVLKIAAVVSTAILIGYGIYRWTRQPEEKDVTEEVEKELREAIEARHLQIQRQ